MWPIMTFGIILLTITKVVNKDTSQGFIIFWFLERFVWKINVKDLIWPYVTYNELCPLGSYYWKEKKKVFNKNASQGYIIFWFWERFIGKINVKHDSELMWPIMTFGIILLTITKVVNKNASQGFIIFLILRKIYRKNKYDSDFLLNISISLFT